MRNFFGKAVLVAATGIAASAMVPAAASAAETFDFTKSYTSSNGVLTFIGDKGTKVEVTAYSLKTSNNQLTAGTAVQYNPYGLGVWGYNGDGEHTIDNNGRVDILILQFDKVVAVTDLGIWGFGDTDFTYAVGSTVTAFNQTLSIANYNALDNLFGAFKPSDVNGTSGGLVDRKVNPGLNPGNLFYVSASLSGNNDSFKLQTLSAVPEPATWAMLVGGLGLVGMSMRRRKTAVSFA